MNRLIYFAIALLLSACGYDDILTLYDVEVKLEGDIELISGVSVTMTDATAAEFIELTDEDGIAHFKLPAGIYRVSATAVKDGYIINGNITGQVVQSPSTRVSLSLDIKAQNASSLLIKEIYNGGCQKDDGSGIFHYDKCIILYNNSPYHLSAENIAIGMCEPYNAEASTHNFLINGVLQYAAEGTIPLINGIWYFPETLEVDAFSQVVVNVCGAIDNTITYTNSINYAHSDYYCMYDPSSIGADGSAYSNTNYYPAPSEVIPTSHYLKTVKYGKGNAWPMSNISPAVVLFQTQGVAVDEYASNQSNIIYPAGKQGDYVTACLSIPREWVLDGVEIYNAEKLAACKKRLTPDIDNGYVALTHGYGHALLRKTDAEATSSADGVVYIDTNNSSNDFIEVEACSLRY